MKIISLNTHSPVTIDGVLTTFIHPDKAEFAFKDSWVLVTSRRSGKVVAIPAANIPEMHVEMETEKPKAKKGGE